VIANDLLYLGAAALGLSILLAAARANRRLRIAAELLAAGLLVASTGASLAWRIGGGL
jgi:hypothetical protein